MKENQLMPFLLVIAKEIATMTATARKASSVRINPDLILFQAALEVDYLEKTIATTHRSSLSLGAEDIQRPIQMAYPSWQSSEMKICLWPPTLLVFVKEIATTTATARQAFSVSIRTELTLFQVAPVLDYSEKTFVTAHPVCPPKTYIVRLTLRWEHIITLDTGTTFIVTTDI
jgi:hypothetical protein